MPIFPKAAKVFRVWLCVDDGTVAAHGFEVGIQDTLLNGVLGLPLNLCLVKTEGIWEKIKARTTFGCKILPCCLMGGRQRFCGIDGSRIASSINDTGEWR